MNIPGIEPGKLRLTGPVLADIYPGKIKAWNDPAIVKINPGVNLPNAAIAAVHRSDGSGTTFNFTHYLSQVSPAWKAAPAKARRSPGRRRRRQGQRGRCRLCEADPEFDRLCRICLCRPEQA